MIFKYLKEKLKKKLNNFIRHSQALDDNTKIIFKYMDYLYNKKRNKSVLYTCITGNYDNLPLYNFINHDFDYVCFTDNAKLLQFKTYGFWEIRPLYYTKSDNTRNNRWHKTHPHILFPEYEESIYIDANINILSSYIFEEIRTVASPIIIPKHNFRDCVFDEAKSVQDAKKETKENVQKMVRFLEEKGFPKHYGLNENSFIYRKHNDPLLIKIMDEWWYFIENYTKRDQLSLAYVLWEHQIIPENISIPNLRSKKDDIHFERHN
ncbi:MAG: glycosyltransferase domain-containing protein [Treponema sp.]